MNDPSWSRIITFSQGVTVRMSARPSERGKCVKITTNNVPRELIDAYQLTDKEREQFDYLDWPKIDQGRESATFFRYKGYLYSLDQIERAPESLKPWDGCHADSMFSGILVKLVEDEDYVIVGRFVS